MEVVKISQFSQSKKEFFSQLPNKVYEYLNKNPLKEEEKFDELIIDEAQDICRIDFFLIFDKILKGGLKKGKIRMFGDFKEQGITWKTIRNLIQMMFSSSQCRVEGKQLGFYGNAGVCLFKYFVDESDPQHIFSLCILLMNFMCFICITTCYILVGHVSLSSSRACSEGSKPQKLQDEPELYSEK